jgi:uncharacterized RDD family membrane protein YckC
MENNPAQEHAKFHIELAGHVIDGYSRAEAAEALTRLFRIEQHKAERLLDNRPFIIKRGLDTAQAQKYVTAIRKAGAACDMVPEEPLAVCPKCEYMAFDPRNSLVAADECPACGIIVAKYLKAHEQEIQNATPENDMQPAGEPSTGYDEEPAPVIIDPDDFVSFPARAPLASLFGFCPLENPVHLKAPPSELATATIYHRFWAAVATFSHCFFMATLMQVPVGIIAGIYLATNELDYASSTRDSLRGISFILGICYVTIVLPILWQGHTFGMRAMRIVLIDRRYKNEVGLSLTDSILRALAGIVKWCTVLPLAVPLFNKERYGLDDLLLKTRQAAIETLPARPWNSALRSFLAAIVLHFAIALPGGCILSAFSGSSPSAPSQTMRAPAPATPAPADGISRANRAALMELHAAVMQHFAATMSFPDTPEAFERMLNTTFPPASRFIQLYNEDSLDIRGSANSFEIGIWQGDFWAVIDDRGRLSKQDNF